MIKTLYNEDTVLLPVKLSNEPSVNIDFLRTEGRKYIETLSRKLWTDYNIHDPGILIKDVLAYAITDLGYRLQFPIEDILSENPDGIMSDFPDGNESLTTAPLTMKDYRKILIDIEGIDNAWFQKKEILYWADLIDSVLTNEKHPRHESIQINLKGVYNIHLQINSSIRLNDTDQINTIKNKALSVLHSNRTICQDFENITIMPRQDYVTCAEIDIKSECNQNEILARIFYEVQNVMTPLIKRYALSELFDRGYSVDEIADGPMLQHGFIIDEELDEQVNLDRSAIRLSDCISAIMNIAGVLSIRDIHVHPADIKAPLKNQWDIPVAAGIQPLLNILKSRIVFFKNNVPVYSDMTIVKKKLSQLQQADKKVCDPLFSTVKGENRQIGKYYSIQNEFPECYGIGQNGLPESSSDERLAHAKQLKAYLLFFDQILANYFAQLKSSYKLFSTDTLHTHTKFTQPVDGCKEVEALINDNSSYPAAVQNITESEDEYLNRRNAFLDHLLARFGESFSEYVATMYSMNSSSITSALKHESIAVKARFLKKCVNLSKRRHIAFDYTKTPLWDSEEVGGVEKRASALLGILNIRRRSLAEISYDVYQENDFDTIDEYRFRIIDPENGKILLSSSKKYRTRDAAITAMKSVIQIIISQGGITRKVAKNNKYYFNIVDTNNSALAKMGVDARRIEYFNSEEERELAIQRIINIVAERYSDEGMYVVEHLLLRPLNRDSSFMPVCITNDKCGCGSADPYSNRITIILPAYSPRFSKMEFRRFAETTIRLETPAHVVPRICWIDQEQMGLFEPLYKQWLELYTNKNKNEKYNEITGKLIDILSRLKCVYTQSNLGECTANSSNFFLLDQTQLGSEKE
jgi:uncharacterized protein YegP (UPF0339 family)